MLVNSNEQLEELLTKGATHGLDADAITLHVATDADGVRHASSDYHSDYRFSSCCGRAKRSTITLTEYLSGPRCLTCLPDVSTRGGWSSLGSIAYAVELVLDVEALLDSAAGSVTARLQALLARPGLERALEESATIGNPRSMRPFVSAAQRRLRAEAGAITVSDAEISEVLTPFLRPSHHTHLSFSWLRTTARLDAAAVIRRSDLSGDPLDELLIERFGHSISSSSPELLLLGPCSAVLHLLRHLEEGNLRVTSLDAVLTAAERETFVTLMRDDVERPMLEAAGLARALAA